ncbi:MAG: hypothetical protein KGJ86_00010 [Chloroflexota bacterium]|nr:hypothetical protein [Chloroflexota bacterium]
MAKTPYQYGSDPYVTNLFNSQAAADGGISGQQLYNQEYAADNAASSAPDVTQNYGLMNGAMSSDAIVPTQNYTNMAAVQAANQQAMLAYYEERLHQLEIPQMQQMNQLEQDKLAFQKAQQTWLQVYQEASLNGRVPLLDANGNPTGGFSNDETLAAKQQENQTYLDYLKLISGLNNPKNMFDYLRVLNNTPQGLKDVVNRAAGRFNYNAALPGQAGVAQTAAQLTQNTNTVDPAHVAAAAAGAVAGATNAATVPTAAPSSPSGATAQPDGSVTMTPTSLVNDMNNPGSVATPQDLAAVGQTVNPFQWNAYNFTHQTSSQKDALQAATQQSTGLTPQDQEDIFKLSLPNYGGPSHGVVTGLGF